MPQAYLRTLYSCLLLCLVGLQFFTPPTVMAQTSLTIDSVTTNLTNYPNSQVPKYEKLEISFSVLNSVATNNFMPFDPTPPAGVRSNDKGITVEARFLPPGITDWNQAKIQPAFYYQDFNWEQRNSRDWAYPTGNYSWKVRFAPTQEGVWQYRLFAQDGSNRTALTTPQSFNVSSSNNKGFIRVSPKDPRYFEYEDGSYFPGLGYNFRPNTTDVEANLAHLQTMNQNGIQLVRMWLSSWAIFGSSWNPWNAVPQDYDGYLPRAGLEAFDNDFRLKLVYRASNPNNTSCTDNCSYWKATRFLGWMSPQAAIKPSTNYRIRVRYRAQNITGPRNSTYPSYGLVIKVSNQWQNSPHQSGTGTIISPYAGNTDQWSELITTWNSGTNNFLPYFYLTLENVIDPGSGNPAPTAYIDQVVIEENLGNNQYGHNILPKPSMQHHTYFDQRNAYAFDKLVELAQINKVYLRPVILEKDEYIQNHLDFDGNLRTDDPTNLFYGDGTNITAVRWYQQAWWRYLQARWGYSTAIHSWELINEGNPTLENHYILTDQLGQFMRRFTPNHHLVSTSNWHSFPNTLWARYPYIDFADLHYYQPRSATNELYDPALATYNRSMNFGALQSNGAGKPIIRGETGFVESGSSPAINDFTADTSGIWFKKFMWGQINPGGMLESYWYTGGNDGHIFRTGQPDHRHYFKKYYDFIENIPLNNGNYREIQVATNNANLRVWGQKDTVNNRAHLWVQNINHTWKNVVDGISIVPQSGSVTIAGFTPNLTLPLETWDTNLGTFQTSSATTTSTGDLNLVVTDLNTDIAYKIGDYSLLASPTPSPTPHPGDIDGDGDVDLADYNTVVTNFGSSYHLFNFNSVVSGLTN